MSTVILVIHLILALAMIGVVLIQKSEGGGLGMGGGGMSGFMTGRSTANLLTRTTGILAVAFFCTSVILVILSNRTGAPRSLLDQGAPTTQEAPTPAPPAPAPEP